MAILRQMLMAGNSVEETFRAGLCLNLGFCFRVLVLRHICSNRTFLLRDFPILPPVFVEFLYASLRRWAIDCSTEVRPAGFIQHTCNESIWSGWLLST